MQVYAHGICPMDKEAVKVRVDYVMYGTDPVFTGVFCREAKVCRCNPEKCPIVLETLRQCRGRS